jgi:hypothetical protein
LIRGIVRGCYRGEAALRFHGHHCILPELLAQSSTVVPHSTRIIKIQGFPVQNGEAVRQHNTKPGKETKIPNNYFLSKIIAMLKEFLSRQQGTTNLLLHD